MKSGKGRNETQLWRINEGRNIDGEAEDWLWIIWRIGGDQMEINWRTYLKNDSKDQLKWLVRLLLSNDVIQKLVIINFIVLSFDMRILGMTQKNEWETDINWSMTLCYMGWTLTIKSCIVMRNILKFVYYFIIGNSCIFRITSGVLLTIL